MSLFTINNGDDDNSRLNVITIYLLLFALYFLYAVILSLAPNKMHFYIPCVRLLCETHSILKNKIIMQYAPSDYYFALFCPSSVAAFPSEKYTVMLTTTLVVISVKAESQLWVKWSARELHEQQHRQLVIPASGQLLTRSASFSRMYMKNTTMGNIFQDPLLRDAIWLAQFDVDGMGPYSSRASLYFLERQNASGQIKCMHSMVFFKFYFISRLTSLSHFLPSPFHGCARCEI